MRTPSIIKIAIAATGALLVAGAAVVITASAAGVPLGPVAATPPSPKPSDSPGSARAQYCQTFVNNFASALGKKPADVQAAAQKALGQTLDQAVKDGKLTQAQADQMKQKAASGSLCSGIPRGRPGGQAPGGQGRGGPGDIYMSDAAKALGMNEPDLQAAFKNGQTLQQIAASKGMNEQQFRDAFTAQVKNDLDAKVKAGTLSQAQEDSILNRLKTAPLPFWNQAPPIRGAHPQPPPTSTTG
jgi:hypothetical protein